MWAVPNIGPPQAAPGTGARRGGGLPAGGAGFEVRSTADRACLPASGRGSAQV